MLHATGSVIRVAESAESVARIAEHGGASVDVLVGVFFVVHRSLFV